MASGEGWSKEKEDHIQSLEGKMAGEALESHRRPESQRPGVKEKNCSMGQEQVTHTLQGHVNSLYCVSRTCISFKEMFLKEEKNKQTRSLATQSMTLDLKPFDGHPLIWEWVWGGRSLKVLTKASMKDKLSSVKGIDHKRGDIQASIHFLKSSIQNWDWQWSPGLLQQKGLFQPTMHACKHRSFWWQ